MPSSIPDYVVVAVALAGIVLAAYLVYGLLGSAKDARGSKVTNGATPKFKRDPVAMKRGLYPRNSTVRGR